MKKKRKIVLVTAVVVIYIIVITAMVLVPIMVYKGLTTGYRVSDGYKNTTIDGVKVYNVSSCVLIVLDINGNLYLNMTGDNNTYGLLVTLTSETFETTEAFKGLERTAYIRISADEKHRCNVTFFRHTDDIVIQFDIEIAQPSEVWFAMFFMLLIDILIVIFLLAPYLPDDNKR